MPNLDHFIKYLNHMADNYGDDEKLKDFCDKQKKSLSIITKWEAICKYGDKAHDENNKQQFISLCEAIEKIQKPHFIQTLEQTLAEADKLTITNSNWKATSQCLTTILKKVSLHIQTHTKQASNEEKISEPNHVEKPLTPFEKNVLEMLMNMQMQITRLENSLKSLKTNQNESKQQSGFSLFNMKKS